MLRLDSFSTVPKMMTHCLFFLCTAGAGLICQEGENVNFHCHARPETSPFYFVYEGGSATFYCNRLLLMCSVHLAEV